jgi:acyl-CoA synthetase (AMP-forming)/AMP-acid ligase II
VEHRNAAVRSFAELLPPPGDELCISAPDGEWTRTQFLERVDELARELPIEPNIAVGISLPNGGELIASMFAVWKGGGVVVPVNPRLTPTEVARIERDVIGRRYDDGVALVSFTSGTTGAPKPVPLLAARVMEGLDQVLATVRTKPAEGGRPPMPNLIPVSLSLWAGIYQVLFAFTVDAPVVVMDTFDTREFASLVRRFEIRSTVLPPAAMVMLADDDRIDDLAPLKYIRSISSPLSPLQARRFRDRFGISVLNGYGQTELGGEVVGWSAADSKTFGDDKLGAVGRPHAGVEVRRDDTTGELLVRIPGRFDEWQHTGDVATIDDDGFVWIDGRLSDMINRGGLKVHPGEVEEVLRLSPSVADAAVVGAPDDRLGEVPCAFVVEREPVDDDVLEALCRTHLAPYKVPVRFERVAALPRNDVGKVLKRELLASPPNSGSVAAL